MFHHAGRLVRVEQVISEYALRLTTVVSTHTTVQFKA